MKKCFFIAGTDTGVGKTLVCASLLAIAARENKTCKGLKPLAAGCENTALGWRNEDAEQLQQYSVPPLSYQQINPIALKAPMAPHIAAGKEGRVLSAQEIASHCESVFESATDFCLVEGAGGWRVPLNDSESLADVAKMLDLKVVLVVGLRLGCINHALLTAEAIHRDGLEIAAWVGNVVDPAMLALQENFDTLSKRFAAPCLGYIPHLTSPSPESASVYIDIKELL